MEVQKLMVLVCHAEVHDGKNHEDKCLQGDDQNVENRPTNLQERSRQQPKDACAEQSCNQNKDHFTGVHVAKQSQAK